MLTVTLSSLSRSNRRTSCFLFSAKGTRQWLSLIGTRMSEAATDTTIAVLFSSGLDSAVLVAHAARENTGSRIQPIYVSAGLAWEAEERAMAGRLLQSPPYTAAAILPLVSLTVDM